MASVRLAVRPRGLAGPGLAGRLANWNEGMRHGETVIQKKPTQKCETPCLSQMFRWMLDDALVYLSMCQASTCFNSCKHLEKQTGLCRRAPFRSPSNVGRRAQEKNPAFCLVSIYVPLSLLAQRTQHHASSQMNLHMLHTKGQRINRDWSGAPLHAKLCSHHLHDNFSSQEPCKPSSTHCSRHLAVPLRNGLRGTLELPDGLGS